MNPNEMPGQFESGELEAFQLPLQMEETDGFEKVSYSLRPKAHGGLHPIEQCS